MAGFEYLTSINAVVEALRSYNTETSSPDLSSGLTTRVSDENIVVGDPDLTNVRGDRYPAIFVRVADSEEKFTSIGATGPSGNRKQKRVTYDIFAMYQKEGAWASRESLLQEVYKFARNIEAVFQKELTLSSTALWCNPKTTSFATVPAGAAGSWVKTILVELEAQYWFR